MTKEDALIIAQKYIDNNTNIQARIKGHTQYMNEWVMDAYKVTSRAETWDLDPVYMDTNEPRKIVRGGSWKDIGHYLETSTRTYEYQDVAQAHIGFRTVMTFIGRSASMDAKLNKRMRR